jgi:hypothetical protein
MPKYQWYAREWSDTPTCPKCLRKKNGDEGVDMAYQVEEGLIRMCCKRCYFKWWMEPAYKNWKSFDKEQRS